MERVAGEQVLCRREQNGVALRHVGGQVEDAAGEHQLGKVRVPADVRVGASEAEEPYARRRRQLLDGWRLGGGDQERGVDLALPRTNQRSAAATAVSAKAAIWSGPKNLWRRLACSRYQARKDSGGSDRQNGTRIAPSASRAPAERPRAITEINAVALATAPMA